jgi:hypothetical protein
MNKLKIFLGLFVFLFSITFVCAVQNVCCEKTISGLFCQNVDDTKCAESSTQVPTSCETTSYCKQGYCFDSKEGTCLDNTPRVVCNLNNGLWSETEPAQCELGCCLMGDQASFVTLTRCKKMSADLGIISNFRKEITNEQECLYEITKQEKGACVYEFEFDRTCVMSNRDDCKNGLANGTVKGEFFPGKLCSAEDLKTNCAPTDRTICVAGKEEVYFVDSCGNPANVYDSSKIKDTEYWSNIKDAAESCNSNSANIESKSCGNCNYLLGSFCRDSKLAGTKASYGDNICADLNCAKTSNGKSYKHGESWCVYEDEGKLNVGKNAVGSRFYKHICINGEEVVESCADFRNEECIEDVIETSVGDFSQAACRVNRWRECVAQSEKIDCENTDKRDCIWKAGKYYTAFANSTEDEPGLCIPKNPPGLNFWNSEETKAVCAQANAVCVVKFEKKLLGGGEECKENCECLTDAWEKKHAELCSSMGDCGANVNWVGDKGYKLGYEVDVK